MKLVIGYRITYISEELKRQKQIDMENELKKEKKAKGKNPFGFAHKMAIERKFIFEIHFNF